MSDQKSQIESMLASSDEELEQDEAQGSEEVVADEGQGGGSAEGESSQRTSASESGEEATPENTEEAESGSEGGEELSEADRLRKQVNEMSRKLKEQGIGIEASAGTVQPETSEGEEEGKEEEIKDISFLSDEEVEELQDHPEKMNAILNRVYNQARQDALKSIPDVVRKTTDRQIAIKDKVSSFYENNPDLKDNRDFVSYVASEVEASNPDKDLDWIFEQTAKEARDRLVIKEKSEEAESDRRSNNNKKPAFATKPRGERRAQDTRTDQQKQIDKVISL